jgi:signal transduction histidine kinase
VETAQPFIEQHRQKLQVRLPETPVWMQGDFARLSQVVGNLLHNAAKYSSDGGTILLELAVEPGGATIHVSDNGIGIEPSLLPSIFELFTQGQNSLDRGQGGLGVGLTLVRRLVELHGGTVAARVPARSSSCACPRSASCAATATPPRRRRRPRRAASAC